MGIRQKGRRKIGIGDTEYIWYLEMNYSECKFILK